MKGYNLWSYTPYKPLLRNIGDIYICRIAPAENSIHLEWLDCGDSEYSVLCRKRDEGDFILCGKTARTEFDITELDCGKDYEFYVTVGEKKSLIRLAATGKAVGTVVNYLHPDDTAYDFSGRYLCSPSLVRHPDGYLLASMDLYAGGYPQNLTLIFRSDDNGDTWHYVSELMPCFWGKMFIHKGELYMLSCSTEYGDLLIGKSTDGGKSFCAPIALLRGSNGKNGNDGVHKNPQNIFTYAGRIYTSLEWGSWSNRVFSHAAMVMSCDENADLLSPESWSFSSPRNFLRAAPEIDYFSDTTMTIEGTVTEAPDGRLLNIMRFEKFGYALAYEIDTENFDAPLKYSHLIHFEANRSKFMIKFDGVSGKYYSVASRLYDKNNPDTRNLLSLMVSENLNAWSVALDIFDYRNCSPEEIGFQYVDFEFDGNDLIFLCRTAINKAHNAHDSNYSTFHRIKDFRQL